MDVKTINQLLAEGNIDRDDMWPRIVEMESKAHQFRFEFGLNELPNEHEIDFVTPDKDFIEVKRGKASPIDFGWFSKVFPRDHLTVICSSPFTSKQVTGVTIEEFLLSAPTSLAYSE